VIKDILVVYDTFNHLDGRFDHDIWMTDFDGQRDHGLLTESSNDFNPRFNVDGSGMFFISDGNGTRDLFYTDTVGTTSKALTSGLWIQYYDVSPAGDRLVFVISESLESNIYLIDIDGTNKNLLCTGLDPVFTDQGDAIILLNASNSKNIRKVTIGSTDTLEITSNAVGSQLVSTAYDRERFIVRTKPDNNYSYSYYFMDHNGAFINSLSFGSSLYGHPALSSDGLQIAYSSYSSATLGVEIYAGNTAISTPKQLTKEGKYAQRPQFFPTDDFLIYTQQSEAEYSLYHVDAKGNNETQMSHEMSQPPLNCDVFVY